MVMMVMAADGMSQILYVGELPAFGGTRKIIGELIDLVRQRRIAV